MRVKKCLSMLLAVIMIGTMITSLPITASAVDIHTAAIGEGTVITVDTAEKLNTACDSINENGGTYTIDLTGSFEGQVEITNKDAVVTVISSTGQTLTNLRTAVYVENGATVKLGGNGNTKLTLQGNDQPHITDEGNDDPGLIYLLSGSTCEMNENVTLKDRKGNNYLGGGVTVNGGNFIMNGGTIENCGINGGSVCYGGGVAVFNRGTFTMNGGTISNCYAISTYDSELDPNHLTALGGGVFVTSGSVFTMNGGTISKCTASVCGGGVAAVGAVDNSHYNSIVNINSGTISDNTAAGGAGVFVSRFLYAKAVPIAVSAALAGSTSAGSSGSTDGLQGDAPSEPGLYIDTNSDSDSILIKNNHADGTYDKDANKRYANGLGGGILVANLGTHTAQIHNAEITGNRADMGAGVAVFHFTTKPDIDNCTITGNTADSNGGGIAMIRNNDGGTVLKNTTITGNTSGDRGAGVYYDEDSELHISGADIIQNNKFDEKLNNLNVLSVEKPVYVDGDLSGSQIGLSDPRLWDDGKSDIEAPDDGAAELLTNGYRTNNPEAHPNEYFTSDHETWIVERTVKTTTEVGAPGSEYRVYTVERHPLEDNTTPNVYANNKGQYIILKTQNDTSGITNANTLFTALRNYYSNSEYYDVNPNYNFDSDVKFLPKDSNAPLSYVQLKKNNYGDITVTYSAARAKRQYIGSISCSASISNQRYAKEKELVLQITKSDRSDWFNQYQNLSNLYFKTDYTEETIEYVNADPPGNVLYEYDEYGDIKAKLITGSFKTKYARTTTKETGTDDEVRLVRRKPDYHINNTEIDDHYKNNDIFTSYVEAATKEIKVGETIEEFYTVPEVVPTDTNSCPYIFKGWYYDQENDNDTHPVKFGTDKYAKDIYAHWIKVDDVDKDAEDTNDLPAGYTKYGGFDLCGVQVRKERTIDSNFGGESMPGGLRFVTSLSKDVVDKINAIMPNNIEYGYVATNQDKEGWIKYHGHFGRKLQYVSDGANGIDTSESATDDNYFGFATNVVCTSKQSNGTGGVVREDHRSYGDYLLYTLVVTYEGDDGTGYGKNVLARPYIRYKDANGLDRVAYSEYRGNSNTLGGCYTSYNKNNPDA